MKQFRKACMFLLVLVCLFNLTSTAYAAGTVSYDTGANKFFFSPGSQHSTTNLFSNFQNVMPGDTITDQILIKNPTSNKVKIRVYIRSLGAQENSDDFLSQLNLTVKQKNDSILFAAPADETAQLTNWVYLGTVYSGGEIPLDLTLEVPITMSSDYQNKVGYVDWEFKVEELPVSPSDPQPPKTGDYRNIVLFSHIMIISLLAILFLFFTTKRRRNEPK